MSVKPAKTVSGAAVTDVCARMRADEIDLRRAMLSEDIEDQRAVRLSLSQRFAIALGLKSAA